MQAYFFGVCAFILMYVFLDKYALDCHRVRLRTSLWVAALVRALMQCFIIVDVIAAVLAFGLVGGIMGFDESGQK